MAVTEQEVLGALSAVMDPDLHRDIVSLGFVQTVAIDGGRVSFTIELTTPACPVRDQLKHQAEAVVRELPGVESVDVEMTAQVAGARRGGPMIPGVKHVIAVASGKGGVGKSTVSCNLAVALSMTGARVGLLDSDIYGPTVPLMMGAADDEPEMDGESLLPIRRYGVDIMSIGFFMEPDRAVVWRGPMVGKALNQFLQDVRWGDLDYLIVDLPPGTGDAPMSLSQLIPITGVVIVMTPQDVAARIANKAILMFRQLSEATEHEIPILGIVENMSGYVCPHCGKEGPLFGSGGGATSAAALNVPLLGRVPIDAEICDSGDAGMPAVLAAPDTIQAEAFRKIAGQVAARVSALTVAVQGPDV